MSKPASRNEAYWRSEYRWGKGRVSKYFRKRYGWAEASTKSLRSTKRQLTRARRRAYKELDRRDAPEMMWDNGLDRLDGYLDF